MMTTNHNTAQETGRPTAPDEKANVSVVKVIVWTVAFQIAWHFSKIVSLLTQGHLQGPDDFLRLHEVRNWRNGLNGWFDVSVPRMNPPVGGEMHWSRLVDVPLAALGRFFELFVSETLAERLAAIVWPTLLLVLTVLVLVRISQKLFPGINNLLTVLFAVTCITALVEFAPARIDHHSVQILLYCLILLGLVNADRKWGHALIGFSAVLSVVIGLDLALMLALIFAWLGLEWVTGIDKTGAGLKRTGIAMAVSALLLYPISVPYSDWLVVKCDVMSSVYLSAFLLIAAGFVALGSVGNLIKTSSRSGTMFIRALAGGAAGTLVLLTLYAFYPECSSGPLSGITPDLKRYWLDGVIEAMGLVTFAREYDMRWYAIPAYVMMNILVGLYLILNKKAHPRLIAIWASLVITFVLGFYQVRMFRIGLFATVPVCAMLAQMVWGWLAARYRENRLMSGATIALAIVFLLTPTWLIIGAIASTPFKTPTISSAGKSKTVSQSDVDEGVTHGEWAKDPTRIQCGYESDFALLNTLPKGLVFNGINIGPAILVFTGHSVIGGNYHRNGDAIISIYRFFNASEDEALKILSERPEDHRATYVALCKSHPLQPVQKYTSETLGGKILSGNLPVWLHEVSAPDDHLTVLKIDYPAAGL